MSDQTSNATLMGAPREIRDRVYNFILNPILSTCDNLSRIGKHEYCTLTIDDDSVLEAEKGLLLTSRQLQAEVTHASEVLNMRSSPRFIHISTRSFECATNFVERHQGLAPYVKSINFKVDFLTKGKACEKWNKAAWQWHAVSRLRSSLASHTGRVVAEIEELRRVEDDPAIDLIVRGTLVADDGPVVPRYQTAATLDEEE
jgi:hypothetical protein